VESIMNTPRTWSSRIAVATSSRVFRAVGPSTYDCVLQASCDTPSSVTGAAWL